MCVHHARPAERAGSRKMLCGLMLDRTMPTIRPSSPAERVQRERVRIELPQRSAAVSAAPSRRPTPEEWRDLIARGSRLRLGARRLDR
jgi:hypothetical protein